MWGFIKKLLGMDQARPAPISVQPPLPKPIRKKPSRLRTLEDLARWMGMPGEEIFYAPPEYQEAQVPKKTGGFRRLLIPNPTLKALQRRLLHRVLLRLRVHEAATGFEKGKSIVDNARPHVGQRVVIKMDLVDFFPSLNQQRVAAYFQRIGWDETAVEVLTRLCTHEGGLPQGAPTSPRLSNLLLFKFDHCVQRWVHHRKGKYTRYADDITISFPKDYPRRIRGVIQCVCRLARKLNLTVHLKNKLRILRRHQQQRVTGLVVNDQVNLPRKVRRKLRAVAHALKVGRPATMTAEQLHGWQALAKMVKGAGSPT